MKSECNVWGLCYASFPMLFIVSPGSMLSTLLDLQVLFYMFLQEKIDPGFKKLLTRVYV